MQRAAANLEVSVGSDLGWSNSVTVWFLYKFFGSGGDGAICPTELVHKGWPCPTKWFVSRSFQVPVPQLLHTANGFGVPAHDPGHNIAISAVSKLKLHPQNDMEHIAR